MSSRRDFIKQASIAGIAASLLPSALKAQSKPLSPSERVMRIAHITDVHILDKAYAKDSFARVLREINSSKDKPDLIINTGDTTMDENKQTKETVQKRWNVWNQIIQAENKIPMVSALGNHDVWTGPDAKTDALYKEDKRYGKQWAIEMLSMPHRYYAFEKNGWNFIALDSINGDEGYQLDDEQFNWLKKKLEEIPASSPICVYNHVPILSMGALLYSTKRANISEVKFPSGDMHNDHQRIKDLFFQHKNVKLCLSGHVHYIDAIEYLGVKYMCNGAVSGNWWGNPISLDEFSPVYTMIDLYKDGSINYQHAFYTV